MKKTLISIIVFLFYAALPFTIPIAYAQNITLLAIDQKGVEVKNVNIFVSGYGSFLTGSGIAFPDGKEILFRGKVGNILGPITRTKITKSKDKLFIKFKKVSFYSKDQKNKHIDQTIIHIKGYGNFNSGRHSIFLPEGAPIEIRHRVGKLWSPFKKIIITKNTETHTLPIKSFTFIASNQNEEKIDDKIVQIKGYGDIKTNQLVSLPKNISILYRVKIHDIYTNYQKLNLETNPANQVIIPFRKINFKITDPSKNLIPDTKVFIKNYGVVWNNKYVTFPVGIKLNYKPVFHVAYLKKNSNRTFPYEEKIITESMNELKIIISPINSTPIANTGEDQTVIENSLVILDSKLSFDPDGNKLSYTWNQITKIPIILYNSSSKKATFTAPSVSDEGVVLTFKLIVKNGTGSSVPDFINIKVENMNQPPIMSLITDKIITAGDVITFNPSAYDPDGDDISFNYKGWMTYPFYRTNYKEVGVHLVTVTVSDGKTSYSQDVQVTVKSPNQPMARMSIP